MEPEHKTPRKPREIFLDIYYLLIPLISVNLYWLLLTIPLITAPAANGALFYITNQMVKGDSVNWSDFWDAFRAYFWVSLRWILLDIVVTAVLGFNIWFYHQLSATWAVLVQGLMIGLAIVWAVVQFYVPAVLAMQEKHSIRLALRNTAGLIAFRPIVMLLTAIGVLAGYLACTYFLWPLWLVLTASLGAYFLSMATSKTVQRLVAQQKKNTPPENPTPPSG